MYFFFFQAEDGIRDLTVTGVQTCALPISCCRVFVVRKSHIVPLDIDRLVNGVLPLNDSPRCRLFACTVFPEGLRYVACEIIRGGKARTPSESSAVRGGRRDPNSARGTDEPV